MLTFRAQLPGVDAESALTWGKLVQINIWPSVVADEVDMPVVVLEPGQKVNIQEVALSYS